MNIKSILARKGGTVVTINPDDTVRDALQTLTQHNYGALIVTDGQNKPIGVISERDIVRLATKNENCFGMTISQVMNTELILAVPQDELRAVANIMTEQRVRHLPVVDDSRQLVGIISIGDVVKAERNHFEGQADTLRTQILAD